MNNDVIFLQSRSLNSSVDDSSKNENIHLIDIRSELEFKKSHFPSSTNIPYHEFQERIYELPPRSGNLAIYYNDDSLEQSSNIESIVKSLKNYTITNILKQSSFNQYQELLLELQCNSGLEDSIILWKPCKYLEDSIDEIENTLKIYNKKTNDSNNNNNIDDENTFNAIDIACGSGRDCLYIYNRNTKGINWNVYGVDNDEILLNKMMVASKRYTRKDSKNSIKAIDLSLESCNPDEYNDCKPTQLQIEFLDKIQNLLLEKPHDGYDLVHVARYLYRPLFRVLKNIIKKNGFILYHTFMVPSKGKPKRPRFLLNYNELKEIFQNDFKILKYQETLLDDGRPIQMILAQKI